MAGVTGVGRTSGQKYEVTGAENFEFDGALPSSLFFKGSYRLMPTPPPIRESPDGPPILPVNFGVSIDGNGIATDAFASVGSVDVDG